MDDDPRFEAGACTVFHVRDSLTDPAVRDAIQLLAEHGMAVADIAAMREARPPTRDGGLSCGWCWHPLTHGRHNRGCPWYTPESGIVEPPT